MTDSPSMVVADIDIDKMSLDAHVLNSGIGRRFENTEPYRRALRNGCSDSESGAPFSLRPGATTATSTMDSSGSASRPSSLTLCAPGAWPRPSDGSPGMIASIPPCSPASVA